MHTTSAARSTDTVLQEQVRTLLGPLQGLVMRGEYEAAHRGYDRLLSQGFPDGIRRLILNDMGVVAVLSGDLATAHDLLSESLFADRANASATYNHAFLEMELDFAGVGLPDAHRRAGFERTWRESSAPCRIAILSFLFNWPSTGGGIIHTVELAKFLGKAGYEVKHFFARKRGWGIGEVDASLPIASEVLEFDDQHWEAKTIQRAYRDAVDRFSPDYVIIADSWNFKPLLAEAMAGYPYILRQQALELLCPLNNLRLLPKTDGRFAQCPLHQLATPESCEKCVMEQNWCSGSLHRAERELSGVGTPGYQERLRRTLADAEAVLVLNPLVEAMLSPYANNVRVATWGMDSARFPWPWLEEPPRHAPPEVVTFFMAGAIDEAIKGFHVLLEACAMLWERRQDFLLIATGDPVGQLNEFTQLIGWLSQDDLPSHIRAADLLVMPTIAQEGLSRTSVEAMAVGRPVVASRIGGLPYTVGDGATGLLCTPGDPADLARKLETLIDDSALRHRMGIEGRRRFEESFTWERVIERDYRPLLSKKRLRPT